MDIYVELLRIAVDGRQMVREPWWRQRSSERLSEDLLLELEDDG